MCPQGTLMSAGRLEGWMPFSQMQPSWQNMLEHHDGGMVAFEDAILAQASQQHRIPGIFQQWDIH